LELRDVVELVGQGRSPDLGPRRPGVAGEHQVATEAERVGVEPTRERVGSTAEVEPDAGEVMGERATESSAELAIEALTRQRGDRIAEPIAVERLAGLVVARAAVTRAAVVRGRGRLGLNRAELGGRLELDRRLGLDRIRH